MYLEQYTVDNYTPGAPLWKQLLWFFLGDRLFQTSWLPISSLKVLILRLFGAKIGSGVRIKNGVRIKFPWRLSIGDHSWIGEDVWIDNLAEVVIEEQVCLSQGVYLCTGNHDWRSPTFDLRLGKIYIKKTSWIGAKAVVGPGVTVEAGAILALGSVATTGLEAMTIYSGNPAQPLKKRQITRVTSSNEFLNSNDSQQ